MTTKTLNICIVDDSRAVREVLLDELNVLGHTVYSATSTDEADKIISDLPVDMIFLDLKLPGIGGLEYLEQLKNLNPDLIVVMMTAYESPQTAVDAIEKGAYDYVIKPIQPKHIELIIKRALKRFQIDQERKKIMQKRMDALLEFEESATNTELVIQELKDEVNILLRELGRTARY